MIKIKLLFSVLMISLLMISCNNSTEPVKKEADNGFDTKAAYEQASKFFAALPSTAPNAENELTAEKILLGKVLYFDNRLSKDETQSCNTCHDINTYGVDNEPTSKGDNGGLGDRNSPTTFNAALHISQFWDGRNADVEEQAGGPILNPVEMAIPNEKFILNRLKKIDEYKDLFAAAYPGESAPFTYKNLTYAIGAYERTLLTPSAFDEYIVGDLTALSIDAQKGMKEFIDVGCTQCHAGAIMGGNMLMKFGLFANYWEHTQSAIIDSGKYVVTGAKSDMFVFKVPSLRNIEKTGPYFHDGSVKSLESAIQIMAKTQNNKDLSIDQVKSIEIFLNTLTGEVPSSAKL